MPVLMTIATITMLRGGGGPQPFFDPDLMRELLNDGLEEDSEETLTQALAVVDEVEELMQRYRAAANSRLTAVVEESEDPETNASDLIARLAPLDEERQEILQQFMDYRRKLIQILDEEAWSRVFD